MQVEQFEVHKLASRKLPRRPITVIPIGDIQYGSDECDFDRFAAHIKETSKDPDTYYIGMGDYVDLASPSNRAALKSAMEEGKLYDTVELSLDRIAEDYLNDVKKVLQPTIGRWLGLLEGHHYWSYSSGDTSDTRLCDYLKAPFLGSSAMVQVKFECSAGSGHFKDASFIIWAAHGRGGGKLQSAPLNFLENIVKGFDADVYLMGHMHKQSIARMQRLVGEFGVRSKLRHKDIIMACTGGYLKGYMAGSQRHGRAGGGYVERGLLNPVSLGGIKINARPVINEGYTSVRLEVSS
jgi:hypothetical protein